MAREMLSPHFAKDECVCRCGCGLCNATPRLLALAEKVRSILKEPMHVHSVCRCKAHNAKQGGSPTSKHLKGQAMDFHCERLSPLVVYNAVAQAWYDGRLPELGGIGLYNWGVHIDIAKAPDGHLRTWDRRKAR
ncbi:MAG: D-Ala-D-Ala carboxypeptidase family metallohydrolase [Pyramidobacter porci]|uniref:YcbK family protein n=1 Tax=Pyramidobacter porci TaxID=2605789 RepID=UPI002A76596A|nr:D-Ala-D-Ala carboxypeptidase family metallohydrolase [Pyramidobacter porci]MDY2647929.1 D-Ala-D-Ala carboxypeptidase family metallohydrolase [Pyramidobacter porci]